MFKVGQKVVCMNGARKSDSTAEIMPIDGEIYTIRGFRKCLGSGRIGLLLVEIVNPIFQYREGPAEPAYHQNRFRAIDYSFGHQICESLEVMTEPELV